MDKAAVIKIIRRFRDSLEKQGILIDKIILYGSYLAGNYHYGSDIDLVIVSPSFEGKAMLERVDILTDSIFEVLAPIEAVALTPIEWDSKQFMVAEFAKNGEVVTNS
jgi:predicted nucleotidyltransferase